MNGVMETKVEIRRLSPNDGFHYYFGYYDNPAFSAGDQKHLCNKVNFWDRFPVKDDVCELGSIDVKTGAWEKLAETTAFNFQHGCMLQWNPRNPGEEIIYNTRDGNEYRAVIHSIKTGKIRALPRETANVSRDGKWALAISMKRLMHFRPVCGYAGIKDPWHDIPQPKEDGIWVINTETGTEKLILNYEEMGRLFSVAPDKNLVINHITFNPDGTRLLFLVRTFSAPQKDWLTGLGTIDRDGKNFFMLSPMSYASHYSWLDNEHLLVWAAISGITGMFIMKDKTNESVLLDPEFFKKDIHCIYSPDRKYIMGDSSPDSDGNRQIYLYNTETRRGTLLLSVKSDPTAHGDIRCDLHNRWSGNGRMVSFDSTHEGFRGLYLADLTEILETI